MMKTNRLFLTAVLGLCSALPALSGQAASVGTTGGTLLVTANTARNVALGGAVSALADDPGVVYYNPAGLASLPRVETLLTHQGGLAQDYTENLNVAFPWSRETGVFAASLVYHGMPSLNDAGGDVPAVNVNDKLGMLSWAHNGDALLPGLAYGANVKFLNSVLGSYSASTVAVDLGVLWSALPQASVGLAVRNLGMPLKFVDEADPLPWRAALAGKYTLLKTEQERLFLAAEAEQTAEAVTGVHAGAEFTYAETFSARLGYAAAPGSNTGLSLGAGLKTGVGDYFIRLDYAYQVISYSDSSYEGLQMFTLGFIF
jgi:hypothetical protein